MMLWPLDVFICHPFHLMGCDQVSETRTVRLCIPLLSHCRVGICLRREKGVSENCSWNSCETVEEPSWGLGRFRDTSMMGLFWCLRSSASHLLRGCRGRPLWIPSLRWHESVVNTLNTINGDTIIGQLLHSDTLWSLKYYLYMVSRWRYIAYSC